MYRRIEELRSIRKRYTERLVNRGDLPIEEAEAALRDFSERLQRAFDETKGGPAEDAVPAVEREEPEPARDEDVATGVARDRLEAIAEALVEVPDGFHVHPKLARWLEARPRQLAEDRIDWAFAEALALGSLVLDGVTVRLTGQDTRRGTFSQRHAVLVDQETGEEHFPLRHLADGQGEAFVYDSLLSEFAAVGFEYGYSVGNPDALVLWEAQFGDFVNGAQVIVDQYLAAAEEKWAQPSRLGLLLPHGYEGQGPEHSSARLERFLELAAQDNLEIVVPSTAAQVFHLLRRQALRTVAKPLVVLTPKSFLRAPGAASRAHELTDGAFRPVLADADAPSSPSRVVLCQGKLSHDLAAARAERGADVALVRLERCYPFPTEEVQRALADAGDVEVVWAQEEPENMGAGRFVRRNLRERLGLDVGLVARPESASPATGSLTLHKREQADLLEGILGS
jgi:2-oxoglutarate dehydrogenase complex dehydrogenase (E1) component-like enzyme